MTNNNALIKILNASVQRCHMAYCAIATITLMLFSCSNAPQEQDSNTISSIDIYNKKSTNNKVFVKPKTNEEIRQAYREYIESAPKGERSRSSALYRLAELELDVVDQLLESKQDDAQEELRYQQGLTTTANLLEALITDYPDNDGNDQHLYRLADIYTQQGEHEKSIATLTQLINQHPQSKLYAEAQFRLGEDAFINGHYINAEDAYTEVLSSSFSENFYERSLFKRGWARYKQQLYLEALDDYIEAITYHDFANSTDRENSEQELFNEYFRAVGLAFVYLGGSDEIEQYFASTPESRYLYHAYNSVSDIYSSQGRYFDAAQSLRQFINNKPNSEHTPAALSKVVDIWKKSKLFKEFEKALKRFYVEYNPDSHFWDNNPQQQTLQKMIHQPLMDNMLIAAKHYHEQYYRNRKRVDFDQANQWYQRYLKHSAKRSEQHFHNSIKKDNVYYLYAKLLEEADKLAEALYYYELAAYDDDLILNSTAAYATITASDSLYRNSLDNKQKWLNKHIRFVHLFVESYPNNAQTPEIMLNAATLVYAEKRYQDAIAIIQLLPAAKARQGAEFSYKLDVIEANSYLNLAQYANAESTYSQLLNSSTLAQADNNEIQDLLALSVYKQGEAAISAGDKKSAITHFARVSDLTPRSSIAATGLYDAIAVAIQEQQWLNAIRYSKSFQQLYPSHKHSNDVTQKLSFAYLQSDQTLEAAKVLENISSADSDSDTKRTALFQAAQLYESKQDWQAAIRSYRRYANNYRLPYPQYLESMNKLIALYQQVEQQNKALFWANKIHSTDRRTPKSTKTDRTNFIAANAALALAKNKHQTFTSSALTIPLKNSLARKKQAMQAAVSFYSHASSYNLPNLTTESTYEIGNIYLKFSEDILASERPRQLNQEELEQYEILLEDLAFPLEDKAIEFYEINISRIKDGTYDQPVKDSYKQLAKLFPVRYGRKGKLADAIALSYE
ncbi:MAG: tetratricopeptide repeat protein [Pseudomonadota bacterium]